MDHIFYRPYDSRVDRAGAGAGKGGGPGAALQQRQAEEEQQRRRRPFLDLILHWGAGERRPQEEGKGQEPLQQPVVTPPVVMSKEPLSVPLPLPPQAPQAPAAAAAASATAAAPVVEVEVVDVALLPTNLTAAAWPAWSEFRLSDHRPLKVHLNVTM